jgi:hypothetical protein
MTSDSSSFREGLVWPREANGCVSHTCSVPFTAWTRENVSVREEASFSRARSASFRGRASLLRTCFMPLAGYYLSMVDFHVYPMHIAEHTSAPVTRSSRRFTPRARPSADATRMAVTVCVLAARDVAGLMPWWTKGNHEKGTIQQKCHT